MDVEVPKMALRTRWPDVEGAAEAAPGKDEATLEATFEAASAEDLRRDGERVGEEKERR